MLELPLWPLLVLPAPQYVWWMALFAPDPGTLHPILISSSLLMDSTGAAPLQPCAKSQGKSCLMLKLMYCVEIIDAVITIATVQSALLELSGLSSDNMHKKLSFG